jgi:uncharacterized DUF497 family protein
VNCSRSRIGLISDPTFQNRFLAVGWVGDRLYSVIFEVREDEDGEILHLVTLWRSTKEEIRVYEENS